VVINAYDDHDNQIAYLLKLAGRRPAPGVERMARAREAARAEWLRMRAVHRRRRMMMLVSVAATIAVLGGVALWQWPRQPILNPQRAEVARVLRIAGSISIAEQPTTTVDAAQPIRSGDRVVVAAPGGAAFELARGTSVRLASATEVVFESADRLSLIRGAIYVDADPARHPGPLAVDTPFGVVSHVGTQFELRLDDQALGVRVREGEVAVQSRQARVTAGVGDALRLTTDRPIERSRISTSGAEWAWVATLAPPFVLEGAAMPAFLDWVSREQGWRWEYAGAAARRLGERAVLHGTIDGLTPEEALQTVLPATTLTATRRGDRLLIGVSGER
jgi:ferric-dicitrate binding protein FerR (iron transport regulator)